VRGESFGASVEETAGDENRTAMGCNRQAG